jgi:hypothetical protein
MNSVILIIGIYRSSVAHSFVPEQHVIGIYLISVANSCVPEQRDNRYLPEQCGEQLTHVGDYTECEGYSN